MPPRVFVAEIGFLATCWVGFFAAWFIARLAVPALPPRAALRHVVRAMLIVPAAAFAAGVAGYALGLLHGPDYSSWADFAAAHQVEDVPSFVQVAYIHNAGYLGALIGLTLAIVYVRRVVRIERLF